MKNPITLDVLMTTLALSALIAFVFHVFTVVSTGPIWVFFTWIELMLLVTIYKSFRYVYNKLRNHCDTDTKFVQVLVIIACIVYLLIFILNI